MDSDSSRASTYHAIRAIRDKVAAARLDNPVLRRLSGALDVVEERVFGVEEAVVPRDLHERLAEITRSAEVVLDRLSSPATEEELSALEDVRDSLLAVTVRIPLALDAGQVELKQALAKYQQNQRASHDQHSSRLKRIEDALDKIRSAAAASENDRQTGFQQLRGEWEEEAQAAIAELRKAQADAQRLVHVIGNTGTAAGYQAIADQERRRATGWQLTGASVMAGVVAFAIWAVMPALDSDMSWPALAARAFVSLTFGLLGAFAAQQARYHQERERFNRRMELQLASLEPFIALMSEESKVEVRAALAQRLFGRPTEDRERSRTKNDEEVLAILEKLSKSIGS